MFVDREKVFHRNQHESINSRTRIFTVKNFPHFLFCIFTYYIRYIWVDDKQILLWENYFLKIILIRNIMLKTTTTLIVYTVVR